MTENQPNTTEWLQLFELAANVKQLAPWQWMLEDQLFGLEHPDTGELGFVSVMGHAGQYFAIALYPSPAALHAFLKLELEGGFFPEGSPYQAEQLLTIPQIQLSFEDRNELSASDRELIKSLGLKFRGAKSWPQFRSYAPGYLPWYLTAAEARFMAYALEQLLDVAPRFRADQSLLLPAEDGERFLIRTPGTSNGVTAWTDQIKFVPATEELQPEAEPLGTHQLAALKQLPRNKHKTELDLVMMLTPLKEQDDERPFFPYLLLFLDMNTGALLGTEILQPFPSLKAMQAELPIRVAALLTKAGQLPRSIAVRKPEIARLLQPLADELGLKLSLAVELQGIDKVADFLMSTMGLGGDW